MEKYYARCPVTLEEKTFEDREKAQAWVDAHNAEHPAVPGQPPAQYFDEDTWQALHDADAG